MEEKKTGNGTCSTKRSIRILPTTSKKERNKTSSKDEEDSSSSLVGRIMEKFSTETANLPMGRPSPLPHPSVLPFPVARHRSHGPHWDPASSEVDVNNDNNNEDKYDTDFYPIASFANPIQRKQKKNLDFSRWRELAMQDSSVVTHVTKGVNSTAREPKQKGAGTQIDHVGKGDIHVPVSPNLNGFSGGQVNRESHVNSSAHHNINRDNVTGDSFSDTRSLDVLADMEVDGSNSFPVQENKREGAKLADVNLRNSEEEQGSVSLESQIDAENRARLHQMSPDEIAEAQAELMEKMKPGLVEMLRKRAHKKSGMTKNVTSDLEIGHQVGNPYNENNLNQDSRSDPLPEVSRTMHVSTVTPSNRAFGVPDDGGMDTLRTPNKNPWHAWSERVEAARTLRFALDGTVLERHSADIPVSGNNSERSQHHVDNVTERDFLRTEGDPGATGYTIKEAVELSRSVVPGQRTLALQLLTSVFDKALCELKQGQVGWDSRNACKSAKSFDWEAIWAFALGPEPELALSVRMTLDDNHISVVLSSLKVIHSILSCDLVENFFDISEKAAIYQKDMYTAPIFRSRPGIDGGFLHGGFWKYNTKPSNIFPVGDTMLDAEHEGTHTIQDDIFVAGQDFAAGLIRMGILPRICYLLETDPTATLEEYLISILVGLARHSPTCAYAVVRCPRLVQTIVDMFNKEDTHAIYPSKIKAVTLIKVLAQSDKKNCADFIDNGTFRVMMWHFYQRPLSLKQCKFVSALIVEQLRLWKVCIQYGYCISCFPDFFPFLCLWLSPPNIDDLTENNVVGEFFSITREVYLVLESLARRLPNLHSAEQLKRESLDTANPKVEMWYWSHVSPMVESALNWISLKSNPYFSNFLNRHNCSTEFAVQDSSLSCFLCVISAVLHMLSSILKKVSPEGAQNLTGTSGRIPWLPEFVRKIGLAIITNRYLNFSGTDDMVPSEGGSFAQDLCHLRLHNDYDLSLSSVCCLHGLVDLIVSLDGSIQIAKRESYIPSSEEHDFSREGKILEQGLFRWSQEELRSVLVLFMNSVLSGWLNVHSIERFGRGGPAPGVGLGWGVTGGGFWSLAVLLSQTEAHLLVQLQEMFPVVLEKDDPTVEDMALSLKRINSILAASLIVGPRDTIVMEKACNFLLQPSVLMHIDLCIQHFLPSRGINAFGWEYSDEDFLHFSEILKSHFLSRWLSVKKTKSKALDDTHDSGHETVKKSSNALETIHEDSDMSDTITCDPDCTSLVIEWAHQKLPLPMHWFLSPLCQTGTTLDLPNASNIQNHISSTSDEILQVAQSGLFFLLGLEAMSNSPCTSTQCTPVHGVPLVWKLHSLSVVLFVDMGVLQEEKSRGLFRALQDLYGQFLDESRHNRHVNLDKNETNIQENGKECGVKFLKFQSDVHESYTTFIENLVEHFGAVSYSDLIYGRQVAMYLHFSVESVVRLAAWNALSNAHMLELLPTLGNCVAEAEGYLGIEDNDGILEAYAKSWVSGGLDRAACRGSMSFTLALHHLSYFIFHEDSNGKLVLRNKLAKCLVRDYSRKQQHEGMMLELIEYDDKAVVERRLRLLAEACEGNSSLLAEVEKLKASSTGGKRASSILS